MPARRKRPPQLLGSLARYRGPFGQQNKMQRQLRCADALPATPQVTHGHAHVFDVQRSTRRCMLLKSDDWIPVLLCLKIKLD